MSYHLSVVSIEGCCGVCGCIPQDEDMWSEKESLHKERFKCRKCHTSLWAIPTYTNVLVHTRWKGEWKKFDHSPAISPCSLSAFRALSKHQQNAFIRGWHEAMQYGDHSNNPKIKEDCAKPLHKAYRLGYNMCLLQVTE